MEEPPSPQPTNTQPPVVPAPVMDVVPPPAANTPPPTKSAPQPIPQKPSPAAPAQPKKPASENVNRAIAATVIIVLGLALLAVYAYLAQKR